MKAGPLFFIALRYLLGRAKEGGRYLRGAAGGIALGLIPIIVTLMVADGMIRGITDRYLELGTGHIQIFDFLDQGIENIPVPPDTPGLRGVWRERQGLGVLVGKKGRVGATIRATDSSFWEDPGSRRFLKTLSGSASLEGPNDVLLGEALAENLGAEVGDTLRIMTLRIADDGRSIPRLFPFTIRGIVSSGYRELDSLWCIMNYESGLRILSADLSSSYLMLKIDDPYKGADAMAYGLYNKLGMGYGIYTWKELQLSQYSSYESTRQLLLFIMALIVIVAAVNVSSATSMLAIERQRDIAVLKAFGTSPGGIRRIFIWCAFLTGLTGAVIGIALGLGIGSCINPIIHGLEKILGFFSSLFRGGEVKILDPGYYLENIPLVMDWSSIFNIGIGTILASMLASWIPARRAGAIPPIELLRKY
ncbi:putative lipoprotein releasing system, permease protein [Treponema primitia ZAS-2]|uniref:Putative lipoprotein releasing system, permease protein n=1 Tax=Treponema primitia (strain ATCC BAA-887 / DSM 12427 / ZAS-2) TaxID=545694 RepID=F5YM15_TREPZ|nr:ABC transporter permease [Treponema primitia]AEF85773.1 putative lipoprotein releasing system, permease protein [Treponema primitia ZAS-2]